MTKFVRRPLVVALAAAAAVLPMTASAQSTAAPTGNWMIGARVLGIYPDVSTGIAGLDVDSQWTGELDFTYFFTPNIAAELIAGWAKHTVTLNGTSIGKVGLLPPTLTLQYHFTGISGFRPYVGAGVNYTNISDVSILGGAAGLKHNSVGLAAQIGADIPLGGGWLINLDAKKVQIGTKVYLSGADKGKFKVDPTLLAIGVGKRF